MGNSNQISFSLSDNRIATITVDGNQSIPELDTLFIRRIEEIVSECFSAIENKVGDIESVSFRVENGSDTKIERLTSKKVDGVAQKIFDCEDFPLQEIQLPRPIPAIDCEKAISIHRALCEIGEILFKEKMLLMGKKGQRKFPSLVSLSPDQEAPKSSWNLGSWLF